MIRNGDEYRESIRDGREVYINGERVTDVPTHPMFKPLVDIRARIYDMAHEDATKDVMAYEDEHGEPHAIAWKLPRTQDDCNIDLAHQPTTSVDTFIHRIYHLFHLVLCHPHPEWQTQ